ncbi:MAG: DNA-3-methyladenine glycosylase [Thermoprotei archaeon]
MSDSGLLNPIQRSFYNRETTVVARELLGKYLVRTVAEEVLVGEIVEVEAYKGLSDPASHAYKGEKGRARIMFGETGHAYVYFTYGNHYCVNVVAKSPRAKAGAVLIRSLKPVLGLALMSLNRMGKPASELAKGPGNLTKAMAIDASLNGCDMTSVGPLYIAEGPVQRSLEIRSSERVGISRAKRRRWRYFIAGNTYVSHLRKKDSGSAVEPEK